MVSLPYGNDTIITPPTIRVKRGFVAYCRKCNKNGRLHPILEIFSPKRSLIALVMPLRQSFGGFRFSSTAINCSSIVPYVHLVVHKCSQNREHDIGNSDSHWILDLVASIHIAERFFLEADCYNNGDNKRDFEVDSNCISGLPVDEFAKNLENRWFLSSTKLQIVRKVRL